MGFILLLHLLLLQLLLLQLLQLVAKDSPFPEAVSVRQSVCFQFNSIGGIRKRREFTHLGCFKF